MNKYTVAKELGRGSFGVALLAERKVDKKRCVIKQILIKKMSEKERKQTELESTVLRNFSHPNIVYFWESFIDATSGKFCIVMEFANGGDIDSFLKSRNGRLLSENEVNYLLILY